MIYFIANKNNLIYLIKYLINNDDYNYLFI